MDFTRSTDLSPTDAYLKKKVGAWIRKLDSAVSGVTTICLMQCDTSPSHRVDQAVDCGLWNVVPLLFNSCAKLLDIGGNWKTLSYTLIQIIPNMLNRSGEYAGHGRTGTFSVSRNYEL